MNNAFLNQESFSWNKEARRQAKSVIDFVKLTLWTAAEWGVGRLPIGSDMPMDEKQQAYRDLHGEVRDYVTPGELVGDLEMDEAALRASAMQKTLEEDGFSLNETRALTAIVVCDEQRRHARERGEPNAV